MMKPFAALDHYEGEKTEMYRIRMSKAVLPALDGVECIQVLKSTSHDFIILRPVADDYPGKKSKVLRKRSDVQISCNSYVQSGFFPSHWLGKGKRYKIKKANGCLYICLKEVIAGGE